MSSALDSSDTVVASVDRRCLAVTSLSVAAGLGVAAATTIAPLGVIVAILSIAAGLGWADRPLAKLGERS